MKCRRCGLQNDKSAKYCRKCGYGLFPEENGEGIENTDPPKPNQNSMIRGRKKARKIVLFSTFILFVGIVASLFIFREISKEKINLNDYLVIECKGWDGYGTATVRIDWDALENDYQLDISYSQKGFEELEASEKNPVTALKKRIAVEISNAEKIKNGQEILIRWNVEKGLFSLFECNYKFIFEESSFVVQQLKQIKYLDPFEKMSVTFSGISPYGVANYSYNGNELKSSDFVCSKKSELKNGDIVSFNLHAWHDLYYLETYGFIPKPISKDYTVSDLPEYVSDYHSISEECLDSFKKEVLDAILSKTAQTYSKEISLKDLEYVGYIFNYLKDNSLFGGGYSYSKKYNELYIIYSGVISGTAEGSRSMKAYIPVKYSNIYKKGEEYTSDGFPSIEGKTYYYGVGKYFGYSNPLICYQEIVDSSRESYFTEIGDGFEIFANYDPIMGLGDIGDTCRNEMSKDAEDKVSSYLAKKSNIFNMKSELTKCGEYLLIAKNQGSKFELNNTYIIVYSASISFPRSEARTLYFPVEYNGLVNLPNGEYLWVRTNEIVGWRYIPNTIYSMKGYVDENSMYTELITANRDKYTYEMTDGLTDFGK